MRRLLLAVLALPLIAAAPRGTVALGVGASSSNEVVVKIDGKNATVKLAGVNNGTYAGQAFLQCLVANRVLRVDRAAGRVTMLDGTSVADHVAEFLQTRTQTDPCTLGKAAYVSATPALASSVVVKQPGEASTAAPAKREGHVSFPSGPALGAINMPLNAGEQPQRATPPGEKTTTYSDTPAIYRPPTVGTVTPPTAQTYTPPSASTYTPPGAGTTNPSQAKPYTPPSPGTTTIPTTSTNPP